MTPLVPLALLLFAPFVLALFWTQAPRRAALIALVTGWLVLPVAQFDIAGWPNPDKLLVTCGAVGLGIFLFDRRSVFQLRPIWLDLPVLAFCLSPAVTSMLAGLGSREAASVVFQQTLRWAIPYLVGRLYCGTPEGLRSLARGLFLGGLFYAPLCLYEMVAGPDLHRLVYGFVPFDLKQAYRLGGWRPSVFQHMGLMAALWMGSASLAGIWAFRRNTVLVTCLALTTVAMRSLNAIVLLTAGVALLWTSTYWRTRLPVLTVILAIPLFVASRATGVWTGEGVTDLLAPLSVEKAESISYRFVNENLVAANVRARPFWGLGRGPQMCAGPAQQEVVCDSLWIIVYAQFGAAGLAGLLTMGLLPVVWFLRALPAHRWAEDQMSAPAALALILVVAMLDNLLNDMGNPLFAVAGGGLAAFSTALLRAHRKIGDPQSAGDASHQKTQPGAIRTTPIA